MRCYKPNNLATINTVNRKLINLNSTAECQLNLHESFLEIEFMVLDDAGALLTNGDNVRLVNYSVMAKQSNI